MTSHARTRYFKIPCGFVERFSESTKLSLSLALSLDPSSLKPFGIALAVGGWGSDGDDHPRGEYGAPADWIKPLVSGAPIVSQLPVSLGGAHALDKKTTQWWWRHIIHAGRMTSLSHVSSHSYRPFLVKRSTNCLNDNRSKNRISPHRSSGSEQIAKPKPHYVYTVNRPVQYTYAMPSLNSRLPRPVIQSQLISINYKRESSREKSHCDLSPSHTLRDRLTLLRI